MNNLLLELVLVKVPTYLWVMKYRFKVLMFTQGFLKKYQLKKDLLPQPKKIINKIVISSPLASHIMQLANK